MISPIGDPDTDTRKHADLVFERIITPAMERFHFDETVRSDHLNEPGRLSDSIFRHIADDELCIAVLTDHNPNVCYEVGIAHTHGTPVVMLLRKGQHLPSDLADLRTVFYDIENPDKSIQAVRSHIDEISESAWTAQSIVPGAVARQRFEHDVFISVPMTSMREQYRDLRSKVLVLGEELKKHPLLRRVYSAAFRIEEVGDVDPQPVAWQRDIAALRSSKYYVLLHPGPARTSAVVEAGYALAMGKPSVYLYRNREDLPFMLQEAGVHMLAYDEDSFRERCMHIPTLLSASKKNRR